MRPDTLHFVAQAWDTDTAYIPGRAMRTTLCAPRTLVEWQPSEARARSATAIAPSGRSVAEDADGVTAEPMGHVRLALVLNRQRCNQQC